jgi:hypothetical protein
MNQITAVYLLSVGQLAMAVWLAVVLGSTLAGRPLWPLGVVAAFIVAGGAIVGGARNVPTKPSFGRLLFVPIAYASIWLGLSRAVAWARGWLRPGSEVIDLVVVTLGASMLGALIYDMQRQPRQ